MNRSIETYPRYSFLIVELELIESKYFEVNSVKKDNSIECE